MAGPAEKKNSQAGFSLIEVLVAMTIVITLGLLALPRFAGTLSQANLQATAVALALDLKAGHSDAMRYNEDRVVTVDLANKSFWLDTHASTHKISPTIRITVSGSGLTWLGDDKAEIRFKADGGASDALISLQEGDRAAVITVDWLAGATRLEWKSPPS